MTVQAIKIVLLGCVVINYAVLITWFAAFVLAHDWIYGMHLRWFSLSAETFDAIHYAGLAVYKIGILLFLLIPLIAITVAL